MLLMIDNYDSFTYNVVQYLGELGAEVAVYRNDEITLEEIWELRPERIVISPGPCTPDEAGISIDVVRQFGPTTPLLGICLGHQSIGQAFGGECGARPRGDARQDIHDSPWGRRRALAPSRAVRSHALSLAHRRKGLPAKLPGGHGMDGTRRGVRRDNGRAPSRIPDRRGTVPPGIDFHEDGARPAAQFPGGAA